MEEQQQRKAPNLAAKRAGGRRCDGHRNASPQRPETEILPGRLISDRRAKEGRGRHASTSLARSHHGAAVVEVEWGRTPRSSPFHPQPSSECVPPQRPRSPPSPPASPWPRMPLPELEFPLSAGASAAESRTRGRHCHANGIHLPSDTPRPLVSGRAARDRGYGRAEPTAVDTTGL